MANAKSWMNIHTMSPSANVAISYSHADDRADRKTRDEGMEIRLRAHRFPRRLAGR